MPLEPADLNVDLLDQLLAERSLRHFIEQAWPVLEPYVPFEPNWHIDCICEHLEAVRRREIRDLLINVPIRHGKSKLVSVYFPAWVWTTAPWEKFLSSSYAEGIAFRDAVYAREIIRSDWYQARWGHVFRIIQSFDTKERYQNQVGGFRVSAGSGGAIRGEGGDFLLVDDPHDSNDNSDVLRAEVLRWWDEVMSARVANPRTSCRVIIMQRLHEQDLAGHILERGGWHHLCLPARWEPRVYGEGADIAPQPHDDCPIYSDPRSEPGELIWPGRFDEAELSKLELDMREYGSAGQLQQRPVPRQGSMLDPGLIKPLPIDLDRSGLRILQFWDLSYSSKQTSDFTAAATLGFDPVTQNMYLLHVYNERLKRDPTDPETIRILESAMPKVDDTLSADGQEVELSAAAKMLIVARMAQVIIQQEPHTIGIEKAAFRTRSTRDIVRLLHQVLRNLGIPHLSQVRILAIPVDTDKQTRANLPAGRMAAGFVHADLKARWWPAFARQLKQFGRAANDDMVDAFSGVVQLALDVKVIPPVTVQSVRLVKR